jgi:hypothetical protein
MDNEMRNVEKVVEKKYVHDDGDKYASKSLAGTALGFGIGGAALALWNSGILGGGCGGGGGCNSRCNNGPTPFEAWQKECQDTVALMKEMAAAREKDVNEKFGLYKSQVDGDFGLYKTTRDLYDTLNERYAQKFCELDKKVYGMEIANLYQNKIIQMSMDNVLDKSVNYTDRKTCKALYGVVGLPSTPTVTVFEGANANGCMRSAAQAATGG